jgi:fatty acid desaturase
MGGKYRKKKEVEMTLRRHSRPRQRAARRVAVATTWALLAVVVAALPLASWVRLWQTGDQVTWVPALLGTAFMLLVSFCVCGRRIVACTASVELLLPKCY